MPTYNASAFRAASPGLGALAQALVGGNQPFEQGREQAVTYQSKIANALAQQRAHDASADLATAKAATERAGLDAQSPTALRDAAMLNSGIPSNEAPTVDAYLQTGKLGSRYDTPAVDGVGPVMPVPDWASKLGAVASMIGGNRNAIAIGDKNSENVAKARSIDRASSLSDAIIAGTQNRNTVAGAQAAMDGKPMFHAGSDGGVLDLFQGSLDTSNPLAKSTIGLRGAQAGNQTAAAAAHYAQAGASSALADQRRTVTAAGKGGPDGKVPIGYRWTTDDAGEAKLEPIPGGPKDPNSQTGKPLPASAAKGYLDNQTNLLRAQKALALVSGDSFDGVQGDPEATGIKGILPNQVLNRVDPKGVETRAALADLGSMVIHDRSGAAVTASEFPRLAPFIPTVYDSKDSARKKLQQFEQNYRAITEDAAEFYRASGYNVPAMRPRDHAAAPKAGAVPTTAKAAGAGFTYLGKE